jgi:hypothetical protein
MSKKTPSSDINVTAFEILRAVISEPAKKPPKNKTRHKKNPAAVALGRLGGKKGGIARAKKLSPERRQEIARRAALIRYGQKP